MAMFLVVLVGLSVSPCQSNYLKSNERICMMFNTKRQSCSDFVDDLDYPIQMVWICKKLLPVTLVYLGPRINPLNFGEDLNYFRRRFVVSYGLSSYLI